MPHSTSSSTESQDITSYDKLSDEAQTNAAELAPRITTELKTLQDHPWAGLYYEGDGRGENVSLMLAPTTGYLFEWHGCMGLYDRNFGRVAVKKGNLHLSFTFPNVREGFQGIADEFVPVSWGKRMYLIPADDMVGFCNDVNSGAEPRTRVYGKYLLREDDDNLPIQVGWKLSTRPPWNNR